VTRWTIETRSFFAIQLVHKFIKLFFTEGRAVSLKLLLLNPTESTVRAQQDLFKYSQTYQRLCFRNTGIFKIPSNLEDKSFGDEVVHPKRLARVARAPWKQQG